MSRLIRHKLEAIGLAFTLALFSAIANAQDMGFSVWQVVNDNECRARITFLGAREFLFESGQQVATKSYKIKPYGKTEFHKFRMRTTSHNGKVNCAGKTGAGLGAKQDTFVLFNDDLSEMTFYGAPKADSSFNIVFRKVIAPSKSKETQAVEPAANATTNSENETINNLETKPTS